MRQVCFFFFFFFNTPGRLDSESLFQQPRCHLTTMSLAMKRSCIKPISLSTFLKRIILDLTWKELSTDNGFGCCGEKFCPNFIPHFLPQLSSKKKKKFHPLFFILLWLLPWTCTVILHHDSLFMGHALMPVSISLL